MTLSRLKTFITSQLIIFFVLFFGLHHPGFSAWGGIAPEKNISLVQGKTGIPEWKIIWDKARKLVLDEDYAGAVKAYADLYGNKPNIEEANWEYCKVLLKIEDFSTAGKIIGGLLDKNPNNSEYLLAGGSVATHKKNYTAAISYYGRVFEKNPTGPHSDTALLGLASSLRNQGKKELAFALFEQFLLRHPENSTIMHTLAIDADELGKDNKARILYARLLENPAVEDQIILEALQVFDAPGYEAKRSGLWLEYLNRHPDHMIFRQNLVAYYMGRGEFEAALLHLAYLADNNENNADFLLAAGRISLHDLKRPDKALVFYGRYMQNHPEDLQIKQEISKIQTALALDFLAIVENGGADQLWQDLNEIALNRQEIFIEIAELLNKEGRHGESIEVLEIIYDNSSREDGLTLQIARQYYQMNQYSRALDYLDAVALQKNKTKSYYLMKGDSEQHLGLEMEALASFLQGLTYEPGDVRLREASLQLAGKIGDAEKMISLFRSGFGGSKETVPVGLLFTYMDLLAYNFLFAEYDTTSVWARNLFADSPETLSQLDIHRASSLRREGKPREAEQLLRQILNKNILVEDILFQLTDNAVQDKKIEAAHDWYQALAKQTSQAGDHFSLNPSGCRMLLLKVDILTAEGHYKKAQALLEDYQEALANIHISRELQPFMSRMARQRCLLSFYRGHSREAYQQCGELLDKGPFDPELLVVQEVLRRKLKMNGEKNGQSRRLYIDGNPVLTRLLPLAEKEMEYLDYAGAEKHLAAVLREYPDSIVGNTVWAKLMVARGKGDRAVDSLSRLAQRFPLEPYYYKMQIEAEVRRGRYTQGLAIMEKEAGGGESIEELAKKLASSGDIEEKLTLARLLWGNKQQEKSLQIYQQLLSPPVLELLSEKFRQKQIDYNYLTREKTFWNSIMLMLQSEPELLAELMEPPFLLDNRGSETGIIVAEFFADYSWQKMITNEYMARKAIFEGNYYYAEQSYKNLLKDDSSEGMIDLATIYGKIGKYRKEAQVYEALQKSGSTSPDLQESIERNTLQISPQSTFDAGYIEKNGRDGSINVARTSLGTSFRFTPDLDKDIQFGYTNNSFASAEGEDQSAGSNLLYALTTYEFTKAYELILGVGAEKVDNDSDIIYQYEIGIKGQLDDYITGYAMFEKRPVYDTISAIEQQVTFQSLGTGLRIETPVGVSLGGDLDHRYYSDDNAENRFHGYSSYSIFGKSLQLALGYDFHYQTSDNKNSLEQAVSKNSSYDESIYWSPSTFTEHRVTLHFQHDFLGYEQGSKRGMSYYAIDNGVGLEDNENITFTTNLNIFLEMSPHFLLKGNFTFTTGDDYEEKGLSMSLNYRW
jgi:tetratricopeptide (TPR) repeat protein